MSTCFGSKKGNCLYFQTLIEDQFINRESFERRYGFTVHEAFDISRPCLDENEKQNWKDKPLKEKEIDLLKRQMLMLQRMKKILRDTDRVEEAVVVYEVDEEFLNRIKELKRELKQIDEEYAKGSKERQDSIKAAFEQIDTLVTFANIRSDQGVPCLATHISQLETGANATFKLAEQEEIFNNDLDKIKNRVNILKNVNRRGLVKEKPKKKNSLEGLLVGLISTKKAQAKDEEKKLSMHGKVAQIIEADILETPKGGRSEVKEEPKSPEIESSVAAQTPAAAGEGEKLPTQGELEEPSQRAEVTNSEIAEQDNDLRKKDQVTPTEKIETSIISTSLPESALHNDMNGDEAGVKTSEGDNDSTVQKEKDSQAEKNEADGATIAMPNVENVDEAIVEKSDESRVVSSIEKAENIFLDDAGNPAPATSEDEKPDLTKIEESVGIATTMDNIQSASDLQVIVTGGNEGSTESTAKDDDAQRKGGIRVTSVYERHDIARKDDKEEEGNQDKDDEQKDTDGDSVDGDGFDSMIFRRCAALAGFLRDGTLLAFNSCRRLLKSNGENDEESKPEAVPDTLDHPVTSVETEVI